MIKKLAASTVRNLSDSARQIHNPKGLADDMLRALAYENGQVRVFKIFYKGPYFNNVSMFLSIFDQLSTLVSRFTK